MNNDRYFQDHIILSEKEVNKREQALKEEDLKNFITNFKAKVNSSIFEEKLLKYIHQCIESGHFVSLIFTYPATDEPFARLVAFGISSVRRNMELDDPEVFVGEVINTSHGWITEKEYKHIAKRCYDAIQDRIKELGFKVKDEEHYDFSKNFTGSFDVHILNR